MDREKASIIFTEALRAQATRTPRYAGPLLHRWARMSDADGSALRTQLERAAAWVSPALRPRVLGQLLAKSAPDKHVHATVGALLLAKCLADLGFDVQCEPQMADGTPDFLVRRAGQSYCIEVRRVEDRTRERVDYPIARLRDALFGVRTHRPISVRSINLGAGASVKPFITHLEALWSSDPEPGRRVFSDGATLIVYDLHPAYPTLMPTVVGWSAGMRFGRPHAAVREHIEAKLRKYKFPIIVALDFEDLHDAFVTVEDVLVGQRVIQIPVDLTGQGPAGSPTVRRATDGLVHMRGTQGERARTRLEGVLPFALRSADDGAFAVHARLLANPGQPMPRRFAEFAPIPRLVVVAESDTERTMQYVDGCGAPFSGSSAQRWWHVP